MDLRELALCNDVHFVAPFERQTVDWLQQYCPGLLLDVEEGGSDDDVCRNTTTALG